MIRRKIDNELEAFHERNAKEALLIDGARQVGKTYSIRAYGRRHYKHVVEINFIEMKAVTNLFKGVSNVKDLLLKLSTLTEDPMPKGETLVFFDEVQECPEIVTYIKFLVDEGSYRYILSGSLLGVELKDLRSAPVGYLREVTMYPLDLEEFVLACGMKSSIVDHIRACIEGGQMVDPLVHEKMLGLFRTYLVVGGMPAAVATYLQTKNIGEVVKVQRGILVEYRKDATKYDRKHKLQILKALDLIPEELNRKNKRFSVADLKAGSRYEREQDSFLWLEEAGIGLPVRSVDDPHVPLRLSRNSAFFKLFLNDVGLLAAMYMDGIQYRILSEETDVNFGAVYENFVAQELRAHGFSLYYFRTNNGEVEVDFLIEKDGQVLPIEVKSGKNYKTHASLDKMMDVADYNISVARVVCNANVSHAIKRPIHYFPIYALMFCQPRPVAVEVCMPVVPTEDDYLPRVKGGIEK